MSAEAQTQTGTEEKLFFYYPGHNEEFPRRVLAGLQEGQKIQVAEAVCFPGTPARPVVVKLPSGYRTWVIDPGIRPDTFVKKIGKAVATDRVRGWKQIPDKSAQGYKTVYPGQRLICTIDFSDDHLVVVLHDDETAPILYIDNVPTTDISVGKAYVKGVEAYLKFKGFPPKPEKEMPTPEPSTEVPAPTAAG
jgi:hypothetical protein